MKSRRGLVSKYGEWQGVGDTVHSRECMCSFTEDVSERRDGAFLSGSIGLCTRTRSGAYQIVLVTR